MASNPSNDASNSRGAEAVIISTIFVAIAGFFVILRCITRFGILRICGADDILILFSLAFSIAFTALIQAQKESGLGRHFENLTPGQRAQTLKAFWASVIVYYLSLTAVKSSLLCQFLRFLIGPTIRRVCWILLSIVVIHGVCTVLGSVFACRPVSSFWNQDNRQGHCINLMAFWFTNASLNILSDIAIWTLPMPALKSLQLPRRQKYGLIIVFALGGCACIISTIRLYSLYNVARSTDITWGNVGAAVWSSVEINVGIICACLPTMKALVNWCLPRLLHCTESDRGGLPQHSVRLNSVIIASDTTALRSQDVTTQMYWKEVERARTKPTGVQVLIEGEQMEGRHCHVNDQTD